MELRWDGVPSLAEIAAAAAAKPRLVAGAHLWGYQHAVAQPAAHARVCGETCGNGCTVHGHAHQVAASAPVDASDMRAFWGTLGCSCFAF
jgi:hypothetical protein